LLNGKSITLRPVRETDVDVLYPLADHV